MDPSLGKQFASDFAERKNELEAVEGLLLLAADKREAGDLMGARYWRSKALLLAKEHAIDEDDMDNGRARRVMTVLWARPD